MPPFGATLSEVEAANRLHQKLPNWRLTDEALIAVRQQYPSNTDARSVLIKAGLLDRLYGTNVFAIHRAVEHIAKTFGETVLGEDDVGLVTRLSRVSFADKQKNLVSFASKYVHFFHDDRLPIVDSYAALTLAMHFRQPKARAEQWAANYAKYCEVIRELTSISGLAVTVRELDHYLWLGGIFVTYLGGKSEINAEVRRLLDRDDPDVPLAFDSLLLAVSQRRRA